MNQPLTAKVTYSPATPRVGETVTFRVVVDDPDGSRFLDTSGIANDYGDAPPERGVNAMSTVSSVLGRGRRPPPGPSTRI